MNREGVVERLKTEAILIAECGLPIAESANIQHSTLNIE